MNVLFCAGGTLGHIYPALSIIDEYKRKRPNDTIYFITTKKDMAYLNQINHNIDYIYTYDALGINKNIFKLIKAIFKNIITYYNILKLLRKLKIKVVIGMGGYISGIVIKAAHKLKIKTVVHEQNSVIGRSNKMVLKMVDIFFTTYKMKNYHQAQYMVGNPRYDEVSKKLNMKVKNKRHILITSGTNGAQAINNLAIAFLNSSDSLNYFITLVTGKKYYDDVVSKVKNKSNCNIIAFSNNMIELINNSGIVISRSGSTTISEILALKAIPILIPSVNVTNNHQYYNALEIVNENIGVIIEEKDLSLKTLINKLNEISTNYDNYLNNLDKYKSKNNLNLMINNIIKLGESNDKY